MARRLLLKRSIATGQNYGVFGAVRIRIEVLEAENMHSAIFLYNRLPPNPHANNEELDEFVTVASPIDLEEWPVGAPDYSKVYPFFRQDFVELDVPGFTDANNIWLKIVDMTNILIQALESLTALRSTAADLVWCGDPADSGPVVPASESL